MLRYRSAAAYFDLGQGSATILVYDTGRDPLVARLEDPEDWDLAIVQIIARDRPGDLAQWRKEVLRATPAHRHDIINEDCDRLLGRLQSPTAGHTNALDADCLAIPQYGEQAI